MEIFLYSILNAVVSFKTSYFFSYSNVDLVYIFNRKSVFLFFLLFTNKNHYLMQILEIYIYFDLLTFFSSKIIREKKNSLTFSLKHFSSEPLDGKQITEIYTKSSAKIRKNFFFTKYIMKEDLKFNPLINDFSIWLNSTGFFLCTLCSVMMSYFRYVFVDSYKHVDTQIDFSDTVFFPLLFQRVFFFSV